MPLDTKAPEPIWNGTYWDCGSFLEPVFHFNLFSQDTVDCQPKGTSERKWSERLHQDYKPVSSDE